MKMGNVDKNWHSRINIFQGTTIKNENKEETNKEYDNTWLKDYFSNYSCYGLEINTDKEFKWEYFFKVKSMQQANEQGEQFLFRLKTIYNGIDGEFYAKQINFKLSDQNIWELRFPKPPYLEKISIIKDLINIFHLSNKTVKIFILWKKKKIPRELFKIRVKILKLKFLGSEKKKYLQSLWQDDLFRVRIFISTPSQVSIEGLIKAITNTIRNGKKSAKLVKIKDKYYKKIVLLNFRKGYFITPRCIDFNIPDEFPLFKPIPLKTENIKYFDIRKRESSNILLGNLILQGRKTKHKIFLDKNSFSQSVLIAGQQGTGKTYLLAQIVHDFYNKLPDIGILILNLGKGNQDHFYKLDTIIKFGSDKFRVPYFNEGVYLKKNLQETATYLIAALGLKNIIEKNMLNVMNAFLDKFGLLPNSLKVLFLNLIKYFEENPYHIKFQTNAIRAIKNRVLSLLSNPILENSLQLFDNLKNPEWFVDWQNGKKIFLDLSSCTIYEKRLLTSAIFQLIRVFTPDRELGKLKNIILVDEAHQILEKPITNNYDDDDYISRHQLERVFNDLLREFRSKGLSFILSDQTPSRLFDCVSLLPSLKILFRLGFPCNVKLISNNEEQEFLSYQKNRQALVINGINGEKFIIETMDFYPIKPILTEDRFCVKCYKKIDKNEYFCPNCMNSLQSNRLDTPEEFYLNYNKKEETDE